GEDAVGALVVHAAQCDLFEIVLAGGRGRRLADLLHGRQQQADKDRDDGDHHQQLDEGEGTPSHGTFLPDGSAARTHRRPSRWTRKRDNERRKRTSLPWKLSALRALRRTVTYAAGRESPEMLWTTKQPGGTRADRSRVVPDEMAARGSTNFGGDFLVLYPVLGERQRKNAD